MKVKRTLLIILLHLAMTVLLSSFVACELTMEQNVTEPVVSEFDTHYEEISEEDVIESDISTDMTSESNEFVSESEKDSDINIEDQFIPIENIIIDCTDLSMMVGDTSILNVTIIPENADNSKLQWTSSDESVVIVRNGEIFAVNVGTAVIVVSSSSGQVAMCNITVTPKIYEADDIVIDKSDMDIYVGNSIKIEPTIIPENTTDKSLIWTSSDPDIASVIDGTVVGLKEGSATITVQTVNGKTASCWVTVKNIEVSSIDISSVIYLKENDVVDFEYTVYPSNATIVDLVWSSADPSTAYVNDEEEIVGLKAGTTLITISTFDGKVSTQFAVVVESDDIEYVKYGTGYAVSLLVDRVEDLTIPDTYFGKPVVCIKKGAFADYGAGVKHLTVGKNVTEIENEAFGDLTAVESIVFYDLICEDLFDLFDTTPTPLTLAHSNGLGCEPIKLKSQPQRNGSVHHNTPADPTTDWEFYGENWRTVSTGDTYYVKSGEIIYQSQIEILGYVNLKCGCTIYDVQKASDVNGYKIPKSLTEIYVLGKYDVKEKFPVDIKLLEQQLPEQGCISILDALELCNGLASTAYTSEKYYVMGTITEIVNTEYGNMYIADENGNTFFIYGTYSADGKERFNAMSNQPKVGDTIKIYGIIGNYNGTPQMKDGWIGHVHAMNQATCTSPKSCYCGFSEGQKLGHNYVSGECTRCGFPEPVAGATLPSNLVFTYAVNKNSSDVYMSTYFPQWTVTGKLGQTYQGYLGFGRSGDINSSITSPIISVNSAFRVRTVLKGNGTNGTVSSSLKFTLVDEYGNTVATGYDGGSDTIIPIDQYNTTYDICFEFVSGKTWTDVSNLVVSFTKSVGNIGLESLDFIQ